MDIKHDRTKARKAKKRSPKKTVVAVLTDGLKCYFTVDFPDSVVAWTYSHDDVKSKAVARQQAKRWAERTLKPGTWIIKDETGD